MVGFKKARTYVEATHSIWFILSAKYGLLAPDRVVCPYDVTLNRMRRCGRRQGWAWQVIAQIDACLPPTERILVLAGVRYREFLMEYLRNHAQKLKSRWPGLSIGKQLQFLGRGLSHADL